MKFLIILLSAALCLVSSIEAGITTNSPYSAVTWNGGDNVKVVWDDDGTLPNINDIGLTTVDLMAGGDSVQILVRHIGEVQASAKEVDYIVPADVGPPNNNYFIKFTAGNYTSYSGTFTIANVNGKLPEPGSPVPPAPSAPSAAASSPISAASTTPKAGDPASPAAKSPFPSPLSGNAANLLPSFTSIATAIVALSLTYLY
jgi:hypothetical protein